MTVAHTNVLDLLGKKVQFNWLENLHSFECKGTVTEIVISLSSEPQIAIDNGEFYLLSDLLDFKIF